MLTRVFRLTDRLGRLLVKISTRGGQRATSGLGGIGFWLRRRIVEPRVVTDSARVEGQVRSLSGAIVILLASVVAVILWATSPQAQSSPIIRLLTPAASPASASNPQLAGLTSGQFAESLPVEGTIIFSMVSGTQEDIFALSAGREGPVRLTDSPEDDRDPAWSPDGQRIAFASRRDGNWELYILHLPTGEITRLTFDVVFEAGPSWSPDGQWLAYEGYYEGNLDIYIIRADGSEGPYPVTHDPAADFEPAWTTDPGGRSIAYISTRTGNNDIFLLSLDDPSEDRAVNLTNTPDSAEEAPAWGPGGETLAYSVNESGTPLVYVVTVGDLPGQPQLIGQGRLPAWAPDGSRLMFSFDRPQGSLLLTGLTGSWNASVQAYALPGYAADPDWSLASLPEPLQGSVAFAASAPVATPFQETLATGVQTAPYRVAILPGVIAESQPALSDRVDGSFIALKDYINRAAGWDFLGRLDQVWWPLTQPVEPGQQYQNWHKAGRAFDIVQTYNQGNPAQIELVPEQVGADLLWRLFVRSAVQDGTLGEPLRDFPWDFAARTSGDVEAYEAGGRPRRSIPGGYYVDFTRAGQMFEWYPAPSDTTWRYNWPGVLYWQYEKREGLDWWEAMVELYPQAELEQAFFTPTPPAVQPTLSTQTPPTGTSPSATPRQTPTPSPTVIPSRTPTPTASPPDGAG